MIRRFLTLGSGEAVSRLLYLLAFVAIARGLGKAALGQFGYAFSVTSYLVLTVQQGFDQIAVRAVSRDRSLLERYVRGLFGLRLIIAIAVYTALTAYLSWHRAENPLLLLFGLICFTTASAPRWAFQVLSPIRFAIASTLSQVVFCGGAWATMQGHGVLWAAGFYVLGDALSAAYLLLALRNQVRTAPAWSPHFWRVLAKQSWPLSVSSLLGMIVYNFDILALGWLASPADLGLYLACYRCATVFSPLLSVLQLSILPAFANAFPDRERMRAGIWAVAVPSAIAAAVVALLLTLFPVEVLSVIYGSGYTGGAALLRVLSWSLPVQVLRSILRQVLFAAHLQRWDTLNMSLAALTSILIDLTLIPRLGPMACAIATLGSESVLLAGSAAVLRLHVFSRTALPSNQNQG